MAENEQKPIESTNPVTILPERATIVSIIMETKANAQEIKDVKCKQDQDKE
jgi:hypothetical protein